MVVINDIIIITITNIIVPRLAVGSSTRIRHIPRLIDIIIDINIIINIVVISIYSIGRDHILWFGGGSGFLGLSRTVVVGFKTMPKQIINIMRINE